MKLIIAARHMKLTEALNESIKSDFEFFDKLKQKVNKLEVTLDCDHHRFQAEAHLTGADLNCFAKEEGNNMYSAIHQLKKKLQRQVKKQVA